jgi:ribosome maturation factor RimP
MAEMEQKSEQMVAQVWALVEPVLQAEAMELVEVEYRRESVGWVLRLFIDAEDGVTVNDCARISHVVSDLLDTTDMVSNAYHLEVSSPGLNRPLRKVEHFEEQIGHIVEVRTTEPLEGRRNFKGVLKSAETGIIQLECDGKVFEIPMLLLDRARLKYFETFEK